MNTADRMNELMHNTTIPFTERMAAVSKIRQDHEDAQHSPPFQILSENDACVLLESLEETRPSQDLAGVRIHVGTTYGAGTLAIALNNGQMIVVG